MDKKSIITGIIYGIVSNTLGLFVVCFTTAKIARRSESTLQVLEAAVSENFIGKLISLGAIINLICFFYFIRNKQDSRAGGVLAVTILIAITTFLIKL